MSYSSDPDGTLVVTNTAHGGLNVSKTVSGSNSQPEREFSFTVTLDDSSIDGTYGEMVFEEGAASFQLSHGESIEATGLPAGTSYTVSEIRANLDGYTTTSTGAAGLIRPSEVTSAAFNNHRDADPLPRTGDGGGRQLQLWGAALCAAAAGLFAAGRARRRRRG